MTYRDGNRHYYVASNIISVADAQPTSTDEGIIDEIVTNETDQNINITEEIIEEIEKKESWFKMVLRFFKIIK